MSNPPPIDTAQVLADHPILSGLDPAPLARLARECGRLSLKPGELLFRQDDPARAMYIVVSGGLEVTIIGRSSKRLTVGRSGPGGLTGEMRMLAKGRRLATARAKAATVLVRIPGTALEEAAAHHPPIMDRISGLVKERIRRNQLAVSLSGLLGELDLAQLDHLMDSCRWLTIPREGVLFRQGEDDLNLYLVVSGRFQVQGRTLDGRSRVVGEIGRGEPIGEMSLLSREPRSATVTALRQSELILLPGEEFEEFLGRFPQATLGLAASVVARLRRTIRQPSPPPRRTNIVILPETNDPGSEELVRNLAPDLATDLARRLASHGRTLFLDHAAADSLAGVPMGRSGPGDPFDLSASAWLDEQEEGHDFLILLAGPGPKAWKQRCLERADLVLSVLPAETGRAGPGGGEEPPDIRTPRLKVLVHPQGRTKRRGKGNLAGSIGGGGHIHLRSGSDEDTDRLARTVAGRSLGLVLGGGGARALAQIGVIKAIREAGLPIDRVGGCSMGAIIAAMAALDWSVPEMIAEHRQAFVKRKPLSDYAIPRQALLKGRVLEELLRESFGPTLIQETWKGFFCVSCDLNSGELVIHQEGVLWQAIRASLSLPGVFAPVGHQDRLLVDGGLLNNLPVDVMRDQGCSRIIGVDVTREASRRKAPEGSRKGADKTGIIDTLMRSMSLSGLHVQRRNRDLADLYLNPPVADFGFLDFEALDDLVEVGYEHAREKLAGWNIGEPF